MIERLDQLTIGEFVEMICGNAMVLLEGAEAVLPAKLAIAMRNIAFEYKEIADGSGLKSYLIQAEDLVKAQMSTMALSICEHLAQVEHYDNIREVLEVLGVNAKRMKDERVAAEVQSRLARARKTIKDIEEERETDSAQAEQVRKMFDEQTAALMAHFKFQIDTASVKASLYAHLVARHNREVKAQMAALKK